MYLKETTSLVLAICRMMHSAGQIFQFTNDFQPYLSSVKATVFLQTSEIFPSPQKIIQAAILN